MHLYSGVSWGLAHGRAQDMLNKFMKEWSVWKHFTCYKSSAKVLVTIICFCCAKIYFYCVFCFVFLLGDTERDIEGDHREKHSLRACAHLDRAGLLPCRSELELSGVRLSPELSEGKPCCPNICLSPFLPAKARVHYILMKWLSVDTGGWGIYIIEIKYSVSPLQGNDDEIWNCKRSRLPFPNKRWVVKKMTRCVSFWH